MKNRIIAFGEVVWDYLSSKRLIGGSAANIVYRCNLFGDKGDIISKIGNDKLGEEALNRLNDLEISTKHIQIDEDFPTGRVEVKYDENGSILYNVMPDVAYNHIEITPKILKLSSKADCIVFNPLPLYYGISRNTLREIISQANENVTIFFDLKVFQHFFNKEIIEQFLQYSTIAHIKERDIDRLSDELKIENKSIKRFCKDFIKKYELEVVILMSLDNRFYIFTKKGKQYKSKKYNIKIKDIVGSGMAFSAGFLHYYLNGKKIKKAIKFGSAASALNSTFEGGIHYFNKEDVKQFI